MKELEQSDKQTGFGKGNMETVKLLISNITVYQPTSCFNIPTVLIVHIYSFPFLY